MKENLILSKESNTSEIKRYFNAIWKLSKFDNEFPINLDEVWMLVYGRRSDAVEALQRDFIENVDFKVLRQNPQNSNGGRPTSYHYLTLSCMEFFIARKVRPVFEVYRQVFHKTAEYIAAKHTTITDKMKAATWADKFLNLNEPSKLLIAKSIAEPLGLPTPDYTPSKGILQSCAELLKEHGSALSAQQFNQRMIQHGYMTQMARPSSNGGVKKFKSIVADGLQYGENQVNPNNPKSTQPLYYADKFTELLNILTV